MFPHCRRLIWLLFLILSLCLSAEAQEGKMPLLIGEHDRGKEDVVAKLFETIRVDSKLPALTRVQHRDSLEQEVCTLAQVGKFGNPTPGGLPAFYKTAQPESISTELKKAATFKEEGPTKSLAHPRYSVAVWQVKDSQTGETQYWVGVDLYLSSLEEFMNNFTDDILYRSEWKKQIAPQCRGK